MNRFYGRIVVWCLPVVVFVFAAMPVSSQDTLSFFDDTLSIGGEGQYRAEFFSNFYTANGLSEQEDSRLLLRTKVHLDYHPSDKFGFFFEIQDSRQFGSDLIRRHAVPNGFEDDVDIFQAYVDLKKVFDSPFSFRVGRQILSYGKQRVLGGFLWSNVARSFDAVKMSIALEEMGGAIDVFVGEQVIHDWATLNDWVGADDRLYGVYSTWKQVPYFDVVEGYYMLKDDDFRDDEVHTIGVRTEKKYESGWDWDSELVGQFGDFRGRDHSAFAAHVEAGYLFEHDWKPRVALGYNYATGDDDPTDGDNHTFDNLYPTNHLHYGQMDIFSWRNMHNIEIDVSAKPTDKLALFGELHFFILDEEDSDAWYNAGGGTVRLAPAGADVDAYVGTELDLKAVYTVNKNFSIQGGWSHFFAGDYIDDTGGDDDADWGYGMVVLKF